MNRKAYLAEVLAPNPPQPFSFDMSSQQFVVAEKRFWPQQFAAYAPSSSEKITPQQMERVFDESALLISSFKKLFQMPKMTSWLQELNKVAFANIREQVLDAMVQVGRELNDSVEGKEAKGPLGYSFAVSKEGHPRFTVPGNCACFGPEPDAPIVRYRDWSEGFAGYGSHNVDHAYQRMALYAGAGVLSALCIEDGQKSWHQEQLDI